MDSCPESPDGQEVEIESHVGCTIQAASLHRNDQGNQLPGDQGDNSKSGKAYQYHDNETGIASSINKMKELENNPYLDHNKMKVEHPSAIDHKDSGYMADFNCPGEKEELKLEFSNSVQKIHTEQGDSCSDQKVDGNSVCVTCEFNDRMVESEVEHAFSSENKKTHTTIEFDVGVSANKGHQEVYKNDNINEESDVNNFICIGKSKTRFRTLFDYIWKACCLLPTLICMDGDAALTDGPPSACSESTQGINSEQSHMILVQRDIQANSQNEVSSDSNTLGTIDMASPAFTVSANMPWQPEISMAHTSGQVTLMPLDQVPGTEASSASQSHELMIAVLSAENANEKNAAKTSATDEIFCKKQVPEKSETIDLKQHQQWKPGIKSKINQDQNQLFCKMNLFTKKNWENICDLWNCKPCLINILVYVLALEPRQIDGRNLVTEISVHHDSVNRQVDGQNVLAAATSQSIYGHPSGSSNNGSQEPHREMDERSVPVNEEDSVPTHPSAPVHESDLNLSMEPLRVSDVSGMTSLPQARSQQSSGDSGCRDEGNDNGFQTDASDLSQLPVTEQTTDGNLFHIAAARRTQNEQPSDINRTKITSTSLVISHGESGNPGSMKLHAARSTDPGNRSATEPTYPVHVPARTSNEDDNSAIAVEMASMNLASGGIRNTKEEASGQGQNENRGDETSIQKTDSSQPKHPQYVSRDQRIKSFKKWPTGLRQRPEEMAECGFYYEGFNDCVRCFHCGVGLQQWLHEDDPWFEHARWSPSCFYVHKNKGNDFVQSVVKSAEIEAAKKNATGKDLSTNGQESANGENKDVSTIEREPDMNPDTFAEVRSQQQELYDRTICRICLDRKRCVIFLPCGHFGTCVWCSKLLQKCPFCRSVIVKRIRTNCYENE